jgi:succinoglycan biosynthesis protein ExoM
MSRTGEAKTSEVKVCVAALTRDRPRSLRWLLASWGRLERPADAEVEFLIVENSEQASEHGANAEAGLPGPLHYIHVPVPSIPAARNAAADFAVARGATLLAFVDDDESVSAGWLSELVATWRETGALLVGGPVLAAMPDLQLTPPQMSLYQAVERRFRHKAASAEVLSRRGQASAITIVTSNWLGHTDLFTRHGLKFDERLALTSGSDAAFDYEVRRRNIPKAWSPNAVIWETITPARLTLGYQMARARDQSNASFRRKLSRSMLAIPIEIPQFLFRALVLLALLLMAPFAWNRVALPLARTAGWLHGRMRAVFGRPPELYAVVKGDVAGRRQSHELHALF